MKKFVCLVLTVVMLLSLTARAESLTNSAAENTPQDLSKLYQQFCDLAEEKKISMQSQGMFTPDARDGSSAEKIALSSATTMTLFFNKAEALIGMEISTGIDTDDTQAMDDMEVLYPMLIDVVLHDAEIAESSDGTMILVEVLSAWTGAGKMPEKNGRVFGDYVVRVMRKDSHYGITDVVMQVRSVHEQADNREAVVDAHKALCAAVKQWLDVCEDTYEGVYYDGSEENGFRIGVGECSYLVVEHDENYMVTSLVYVTPHTASVLANPNVLSEGKPVEKLIGVLGANDDEQTDFFLKWMQKYEKRNDEMYECQFGEYKVALYNGSSLFTHTYVEITR